MDNFVTIVYIEDDEEDIYLFQQHIKRISEWNIELIPILNIDEELGKILSSDFDLIFLDYSLLKTTGIEVLGVLRSFGVQEPIILLSDKKINDTLMSDLSELGLFDYIPKSTFNANKLKQVIEDVKGSITKQPINGNDKQAVISQIAIFYNDGRLISSSISKDGKLVLLDKENAPSTLSATSLYLINSLLTESSGSLSSFKEMKSKDVVLTYEQGTWIQVCIISKKKIPTLRKLMQKMIFDIEGEYSKELKIWNGEIKKLNFTPFVANLNENVNDLRWFK